jgi:hypothetical protein
MGEVRTAGADRQITVCPDVSEARIVGKVTATSDEPFSVACVRVIPATWPTSR